MKWLGALFTLLVIIFGVLFAALNAKAVEINYLVGSKALPLAVILLIALVIGILLSILILGFSIIRLKAKNRLLESKLKKIAETERKNVSG